MSLVSYAQNFEDVMLWRALKHVAQGFYIDVGANDPVIDSVTKAFHERGWRGINIEPMRQYAELLAAQRTGDINLAVAVSDAPGELRFYDIPDTGLSTMDAAIADNHRREGKQVVEETVPVRTLSDICAEHVRGPVHFLKIDVEGLEAAVLRGMDLQRWRPWIMVIEATRPQSQVTNHAEWEPMVLSSGYRLAYFDGLNHYYVSPEHPELADAFALPPNVFDDFILRQGHAFSYPLTEFQVRLHDFELNAYQADLRTQRAHAERDELRIELRDKLAEAENRIAMATKRAEQMELHALHTVSVAKVQEANLRAEIASLYASTSWKISAPVRLLGRVVIKAKFWCRLALTSPRSFIKRALMGFLRRVAPVAKNNQHVVRMAFVFRNRYPGQWQRIMDRVRPALAPAQPAGVPPAAADAVAWTAGAAQGAFHSMLMQEMKQRRPAQQQTDGQQ
ncbi:FkbM family methyltransferase [Noviherbaspirillum galbum]|uniref:FkbM family methyltransferase n=1 Tax=Noviherbaspirillum galbum TaxID=2709383 RepID=A0A6B3SJJ1_9BURK|nr:FkbM family methyltransferase [Noviherbaspirillum galbum]NEX60890.1 FkbM family methyltransferase [Noviherbaspirillum galbum]